MDRWIDKEGEERKRELGVRNVREKRRICTLGLINDRSIH